MYMSWPRSASKSSGPIVGSARTTAMMRLPEKSEGSVQPTTLMKGLSAIRVGT